MSYAKQNFVDGHTLTAAHLNHIEAGIAELEQTAGGKASAEDLSTEADRAKAAEKANADAITAEKDRAAGEEQRLDEAINAEAERAQQAETALSGRVDTLESQMDDATVSGSNTWSARHIVDMLCPPIEETGNPVTCYPVAGYPLGVTASWEPVQDGEGDPSPDNIRPIHGRDSVSVTRCGKNLIRIDADSPMYNDNKNFANNSKRIIRPGVIVVGLAANNYLSANNVANIEIERGKISFFSMSTGYGIGVGVAAVPGKGYSVSYNEASNLVTFASFYKEDGTYISNTEIKDIFTVPANAFYTAIVFRGIKSTTESLSFENIMLVQKSDAPAAYTPYTGQTTTLTLPSTIYGGSVNAVTGEGQAIYSIKEITEFHYVNVSANEGRTFVSAYIPWISINAVHNQNYISNLFVVKSWDYSLMGENNAVMWRADYSFGIALKKEAFNISDTATNNEVLDVIKKYLASLPERLIIAYKKSVPFVFTATGAQTIPALSGVNTLLTNADTLTVTGRADPIKRITDLEDAVASMTTNE